MRPSNKSRSRNKSGNSGNYSNSNNNRRSVGNVVNRVFDSSGPEGKVRGTPQQIIEKYQALARDAQVSNDRVVAENFQQHAEHYSRMLGEAQREQNEQRGSNRDDGPRGDDQPDPSRQPQQQPQQSQLAMSAPSGSALATFDGDDGDDPRGPVETPEGARQRNRPRQQDEPSTPRPFFPSFDQHGEAPRRDAPRDQPAADPAAQPAPDAPNGADTPAPAEGAAPAKRPRTRRKARVEPDVPKIEVE